MDNEKKPNYAIVVAIIGALALVAVPIVNRLVDLYIPTPMPTTSQAGEQLTIVLSDKFDESAGSYDTNLWTCANDCNIQNLFLRDGVLNLQRNSQGWTSIISRSKWAYSDLASLTGKFQISASSNYGYIGWLSIADNVTGCGFHGTESPYVQCDVGPDIEGKHEYATNEVPIKFDTWYSIKFDFDQNSNAIRFYLDNTLIGEYMPTTYPDTVQVSSGIWSPEPESGQTFIDDVLLTLNK